MPTSNCHPARLLSGRLLARNVAWSFVGEGLPLLVGLWAIPRLIRHMGTDRFGMLAIIWMGIGYFSLFDLGIGRALTKLVAERLGDGREAELPPLIATGLKLMFALGCVAALLVVAITPWLTGHALKVPPNLVHEGVWSLWILAVTLPFVISTAGLIGILQAHQRFATIAAVRAPLGIMNFLGPVIAVAVTPSLIGTTLVLAGSRVSAWLAYRWLCGDIHRGEERRGIAARAPVRELLSFGGWVTVSNVVGPLMVYCDRFVIGALLTMTAVAYYTTPYDFVTRLSVVSNALASVLFPALTMALTADRMRAELIFRTATRALTAAILVPLALVILFAREGLTLWINPAFAQASAPVLRWLAVGVFVNSLARLPYALVQGKGRPDLTGKLHLAELPVYGLVLWSMVKGYGITGAAVAWSLRIAIDTGALFGLGIIHVPELRGVQVRAMGLTTGAAVLLAGLMLPQALWQKTCIAAAILAIGGAWALNDILSIYRGSSESGSPGQLHPSPTRGKSAVGGLNE